MTYSLILHKTMHILMALVHMIMLRVSQLLCEGTSLVIILAIGLFVIISLYELDKDTCHYPKLYTHAHACEITNKCYFETLPFMTADTTTFLAPHCDMNFLHSFSSAGSQLATIEIIEVLGTIFDLYVGKQFESWAFTASMFS